MPKAPIFLGSTRNQRQDILSFFVSDEELKRNWKEINQIKERPRRRKQSRNLLRSKNPSRNTDREGNPRTRSNKLICARQESKNKGTKEGGQAGGASLMKEILSPVRPALLATFAIKEGMIDIHLFRFQQRAAGTPHLPRRPLAIYGQMIGKPPSARHRDSLGGRPTRGPWPVTARMEEKQICYYGRRRRTRMSRHCSQWKGSATSELSSTVTPSLSSTPSPPRRLPLPPRRRPLPPPPLREQWRSEEAIISMFGAVVIKARGVGDAPACPGG